MEQFENKELDILISTTVIEVGVDVKNASMIVIFDAYKFGLATLHQLRGRVGRNDFQSYCILVSNTICPRGVNFGYLTNISIFAEQFVLATLLSMKHDC